MTISHHLIITIHDHQSNKEHGKVYMFVTKSYELIYGAKFVQNSVVTLHAPGDLSRASLHQSESWISCVKTSGQ